MSITIANADSNTLTIVMPALTKENYALIDAKIFESGREAIFQDIQAATPEYEKSVRLGRYPKPAANAGFGAVNNSVKLETVLVNTDADGNVLGTYTVPVTIAWTAPGKTGLVPTADPTGDTMRLLGEAFSVVARLVAGSLDEGALELWQFGVLGQVLPFDDTIA